MKNPRDILFSRHQAANPKLDALRHEVVSSLADSAWPQPAETSAPLLVQFWRELILPCRRTWAGLAVAWLFICLLHVTQSGDSPAVMAKSSTATEMIATYRDQQKTLNELLADRSISVEADHPKTFSPKPRTQVAVYLTT